MDLLSQYSFVYHNNVGMGYIVPFDFDISKYVLSVPVVIGSETIQPDTETTLCGYFNLQPVQYIGMNGNEMIFYLGNDENLFENKKYYLALVRLTENRIFSMFSYKAGRDFNLKNNIWK